MFPYSLRHNGRYFTIGVVLFVFTFLVLIVAIPPSMIHPYYGNAGYVIRGYEDLPSLILAIWSMWCWIGDTSPSTRALWIGGYLSSLDTIPSD